MLCADGSNDSSQPYLHRPGVGGNKALGFLGSPWSSIMTGLDTPVSLGEMAQARHQLVPLTTPRKIQTSPSAPQSLLYRSAIYQRTSSTTLVYTTQLPHGFAADLAQLTRSLGLLEIYEISQNLSISVSRRSVRCASSTLLSDLD